MLFIVSTVTTSCTAASGQRNRVNFVVQIRAGQAMLWSGKFNFGSINNTFYCSMQLIKLGATDNHKWFNNAAQITREWESSWTAPDDEIWLVCTQTSSIRACHIRESCRYVRAVENYTGEETRETCKKFEIFLMSFFDFAIDAVSFGISHLLI